MSAPTQRLALCGVAVALWIGSAGRVTAQDPAVFVDPSGDVGIGTEVPDALLHVTRSDNTTQLHIEETSTDTGNDRLLLFETAGGAPFMAFMSTFGEWTFSGGNFFVIGKTNGGATNEFQFESDGDLRILGDYYSVTCDPSPCAPDYVFEPGYELLPLEELEQFVKENRHLPGVPSAEELSGPVNISELQMILLEKVEELTLYSIELNEQIAARDLRLTALERRLEALEGDASTQ